jgi:hypothetical protein
MSNKTNILTGKNKFLVSDLIRILQLQHPELEVDFGTIDKNNNCNHIQDENFIFKIRENFSKDYVFTIYTRTE